MDRTVLYAGPLEDFIARRTALVRTLRSTDPDAAVAVGRLRKPPVSVWAIDQVAIETPELVTEVLAAGADASQAQQAVAAEAGDGGQLVATSGRLRDGVEAAVRAATKVLGAAGHSGGEESVRRIRSTLLAAVAGTADERLALWRGTLDRELEPAGFGALGGLDDDVPELAAILAPLRHRRVREGDRWSEAQARPVSDVVARRAAEREAAALDGAAHRARAIADAKRRQADRLAEEARLAEEDAAAAERAAGEAEDAARTASEVVEG